MPQISVPDSSDLLADAVVLALPLAVRFRGLTVRETMLIRGPAGWGEFAAFTEYDDDVAAPWLAAGIEAAFAGFPEPVRERVPVNATVPAVDPGDVPGVLARFPGADTAKVKVAEPGVSGGFREGVRADLARIAAVRERIEHVRIDANGGWSVDEAEYVLRELAATGGLQYAEQPCTSVDELVELRRRLDGLIPIAADESIRRASDPFDVVRRGGADVAVLKVAPLGGVRAVLDIAAQLPIPVVLSSALESAVGMDAGLAAAAALPGDLLACGLGTGGLFVEDVARPARELVDGSFGVSRAAVDGDAVWRLQAAPDRVQWWHERATRCADLLRG